MAGILMPPYLLTSFEIQINQNESKLNPNGFYSRNYFTFVPMQIKDGT